MNVAGSLTYDTKLNTDGFSKGLKKLGNVVGSVTKGVGVAIGLVSTAITGLTVASTKAYAEYEQLAGGVEKLFQDSADKVKEYANNAYKTAGISANQYMKNVTSISANLIKSLGGDTEKASEVANIAIQDMADNANTFGTSMEEVQNVYSSLARGMFVTLDNLKLGYAGTKAGAEQMIADANRIKEANGEMANLSVDNYADLVEAIHIAQEQMHITGTTAKEASTTIEGSLNQVRASWNNLLTGFADNNADLDKLINNLFTSVTTTASNIMPVVMTILEALPGAIEQIINIGIDQIPTIVNDLLPKILTSAISIVQTILKGLTDNLGLILEGGITLIVSLIQGLTEATPTLIPTIVDAVVLMAKTLIDNLDLIIDSAIDLVLALADGLLDAIPDLIAVVPDLIIALVEKLVSPEMILKIVSIGPKLLSSLASSLVKNIPNLLLAVPKIISGVFNNFVKLIKETDWKKLGLDVLKGILNGMLNFGNLVKDTIKKLGNSIVNGIKGFFGIKSPSKLMAKEVGQFLPKGLAVGITANTDSALKAIDQMNEEIMDKMDKAVNMETAKASFSGTSGSVSEILNTNSVIRVENYNTLELDGEKVYENQQNIEKNKNLQYSFGGAKVK